MKADPSITSPAMVMLPSRISLTAVPHLSFSEASPAVSLSARDRRSEQSLAWGGGG